MQSGRQAKVWNLYDPQDYAELYKRVRSAATVVCRGPEDYEDAVADMLAALVELHATKPQVFTQTPSYIVNGAKFKALDIRRRNAKDQLDRRHANIALDDSREGKDGAGRPLHEVIAGDDSPDIGYLRRKYGEAVIAALKDAIRNLVSDEDDERGMIRQTIILRRFWMGETVSQIARHLGIPKGTACTYSAQALRQLKEAMAPVRIEWA